MKLNHKQAIWTGIAIIALVFLTSLGLAYFTGLRDPFTVTFKRIYPAAIIGNKPVSINDLEQAGILGQKLGVGSVAAKNKYLDDRKSSVLANKLGIRIGNNAAAGEFLFYTKGNEQQYSSLLQNTFNGSEGIFYQYVINPEVVDANLRMYFYDSVKNISPAYQRAQSVLNRLNQGEKFEDLARAESDDKATAQLGGDLGFYEIGQVLPELEDQVSISAVGEARKEIITTRLGYEIIYPVEYSNQDGKKLWHLKHILFVPDGYASWWQQQTSAIKVVHLLPDK